ncbi:hypothetical protein HC024_14760 [Methylococcaceae bacterium WWC4]|nr:hypothetical protein [Methylococcaceae bacterium WWC4]
MENIGHEKSIIIANSHQVIVCRLDLPEDLHPQALVQGVPTSLWLGISMHKEYPPLYRHAWGTAYVSTRQDGGDRYPVDTLRFRIEMPGLGGAIVDEQTRNNSAECPADCKFAGTIFGDFQSTWMAWATHAGFGTWSHSDNW